MSAPVGARSRTPAEPDGRPMSRLYLGVVFTEAVVLLALWLMGRYFGVP